MSQEEARRVHQGDGIEQTNDDYATEARANTAQYILDHWGEGATVGDIAEAVDHHPNTVRDTLNDYFRVVERGDSPEDQYVIALGEDAPAEEEETAPTTDERIDYEEVVRLMDEEGISRDAAIQRLRGGAQASGGAEQADVADVVALMTEEGLSPAEALERVTGRSQPADEPDDEPDADEWNGGAEEAADVEATMAALAEHEDVLEAYRAGFKDGFRMGLETGADR